ncbi:MAG: dUTP diphosphatase [Bacilli bacterium]
MLDLTEIEKLQVKLDNDIHYRHGKTYMSTFIQRKLALVVELSELANEVRCFKFWSVKPASEEKVVLEEFVDCLHFTISLGIGIGYNFDEFLFDFNKTNDINLLFLDIVNYVVNLLDNDFILYGKILNSLLLIACTLEFSDEQILNAYYEKNNINHKRQKNSY